jgi:hypothetical protein
VRLAVYALGNQAALRPEKPGFFDHSREEEK